MPYKKRVDGNHKTIRDGLRKAGWQVWDLSQTGGPLDLAILCHNGKAGFIEVKLAGESLTEREEKFIAWFGPICGVAHSLDEAIAFARWLEG